MNTKRVVYSLTLTVVLIMIAVGSAGYSVFVYSLGTAVYNADVYIQLADEHGKPLQNVVIDGWGGQSKDYLHTDQDGRAFMQVGYRDLAGVFGAPRWPKEMAVKLRFENQNKEDPSPRFQPLYYRFEINPHQAKCGYNVFVSDYDYWFGETWVGTFYSPSTGKKAEFSKTLLEGYLPKTYAAIPPRRPDRYDDTSGELVRGAELSEVDAFETDVKVTAISERHFEIRLRLVFKGTYQVANKPSRASAN